MWYIMIEKRQWPTNGGGAVERRPASTYAEKAPLWKLETTVEPREQQIGVSVTCWDQFAWLP